MRGTHHRIREQHDTAGIIPAYAGNTWPLEFPVSYRWDHPRVCGEHTQVFRFGLWLLGSSPRMRGTPDLLFQIVQRLGIIPAYAGNTGRA